MIKNYKVIKDVVIPREEGLIEFFIGEAINMEEDQAFFYIESGHIKLIN